MELWDDPTWNCDYKSRCDNRIIKDFLKEYEEIRRGLVGVEIPYNIILKINALKEKWDKIFEKNQEDDK